MACVLTVAVLDNGSAVVGHVGDSRLYQIRHGEIRKITHDHSPVGEREDNHEISEAEAMRHPAPQRGVSRRGVGRARARRRGFHRDAAHAVRARQRAAVVQRRAERPGGVAGHPQTVERHAGDPEAAVRQLIGAANAAGGKDNVTVVLVEGEDFTGAARGCPGASRRGDSAMARGCGLPAGWRWRRPARGFRAACGCRRRWW